MNTYRLHFFSQSLPQDHTVDIAAPQLADVFAMVDRGTYPPSVFVLRDWTLLNVECVAGADELVATLKAHHAEVIDALCDVREGLCGIESSVDAEAEAASKRAAWEAYDRGTGPKPR